MEKSIVELIAKKDVEGLEKLMMSPAALALSYDEKNKHFITSHKLMDFAKCPHGYYLRWIARVQPAYDNVSDALTIGSAFDDLVTSGQDYFDKKYVVVDSRINDIEGELEACEAKILECQQMINKDGSRSKPGVAAEEKAKEKIALLKQLKTKTQLTNSMFSKIRMMKDETDCQELFIKEVNKKVFIAEYAGFFIKVELDNIDEANRIIVDKKTTANITTFDPMSYLIQMVVYQWIVEERTGQKYDVRLEVTDKFDYFSRSNVYQFSRQTLESERGRVLQYLSQLRDSMDSGMFPATEDQQVLWNSPYYGFEGYGRVKKITHL